MPDIEYEIRVAETMVRIYCRKVHGQEKGLCDSCSRLVEYVRRKAERCPLQPGKPVCSECHIHCYDKDHRQQIVRVMRFSGPRMIWSHPAMAIRHLLRKKSRKGNRKT